MTKKAVFEHDVYYFVELLILVVGFFLISIFSSDLSLQFILLMFILLSYITLGFMHHKINHEFNEKIVLEYVSISALILAGFLFLNIGRI